MGYAPFRCGRRFQQGHRQCGQETGVPVIFGVLTTDTMQQALERAGIKSNLGWSYGLVSGDGVPDGCTAIDPIS